MAEDGVQTLDYASRGRRRRRRWRRWLAVGAVLAMGAYLYSYFGLVRVYRGPRNEPSYVLDYEWIRPQGLARALEVMHRPLRAIDPEHPPVIDSASTIRMKI